MRRATLYPFFLISLFFLFCAPLPILPFAPFLAILYRSTSFRYALWAAAGCGLIIDLLSASPFGVHTLIYAIATFSLYRFRIYFVDKPIGLAFCTWSVSLTLTFLTRTATSLIDPSFPLTVKGCLTDFAICPVIDALYALVFFHYPLVFYRLLKKLWIHFPFFKKDSRKEEEEDAHATQ